MKQLSLASRECEDRDEGKDDNCHREENWAPHKLRGFQYSQPHLVAISWINTFLFHVTESVFGDDYPCVNEHANGYRYPCERHQVRADAHVVHTEERHQHRERQRDRHDQNRAEVKEKDYVGERD